MKRHLLMSGMLVALAAPVRASAQEQHVIQNPRANRGAVVGTACSGFAFDASISFGSTTVSEPLVVTRIVAGGPADSIGLSLSDLILEINGHDVTSISRVGDALKDTPGTTRSLKVARKDSIFTVSHTSGIVVADDSQPNKTRCSKVAPKK